MKKTNFILTGIFMPILILLSGGKLKAQEMTFTQAIDALLAPLDKNRITTGILYERVMPYTNIDLYNTPSENPPASNYNFFRQAYFELFNATYNNNNWVKPSHLRSMADAESYEERYTLGILDYQFNMIDSNAVNNGTLTFGNGLFYDVPGSPSPYWLRRVQIVSILAEQIPSGVVSVRYNSNFLKTNLSVQVSSVLLNFGSIGNFTLSPSDSVVQINFTGSGKKDFSITVNYSNGSSFTNSSQVQIGYNTGSYITRPNNIGGTAAPLPDVSFWISSKSAYQGYEESQPAYGKAKISIWWKLDANNQPVPGINKPIIILDGIDALDVRPDTSIYKLFSYDDPPIKNIDFAFELRRQGFDLIVMDMPAYTKNLPITINDPTNSFTYPKPLYDNLFPPDKAGLIFGGADYIQRNAYNFEYLIDYVNQQLLANSSTEKIVIVGPSMGGQISRYALRHMEQTGQNHNCRLWVSFDSNHEGAYVPVGIQYSILKLSEKSEEAQRVRDIWINSPTAKQTALHHYLSGSESVAGAPNFFNIYYNEINNPSFGFPQASGLRKIAMISGSDLGVPQTFGTACQLATEFEVKYKPRGFLNWITTFYVSTFGTITALALNPIVKHSTYLAPATGSCVSFKFHHALQPDYTKNIIAPNWSNTSLDMLQGGFFPAFEEYRKSLDSINEKKLYSFWQKFITVSVKDHIGNGVQQPTYNTLAIGLGSLPDPTRKWDANFRIDKYNQPCDVTCPETQESPFDMYWGPDINTRHDSLLLGHVVRLRKEIIDKQAWQKTQIQRQSTIQASKNYMCNGESLPLSMVNPLPNMTYSWTTGNTNLQISGSGPNVTLLSNGASAGYYVISCQASSPCYLVTANFTIHVGGYSSSDYPVSGPSVSCNNTYVYFSTNVLPGATDYVWFWPASNWTYISGNHTPYIALRTGTASGPVGVRVANACDPGGSPGIKFVQVNNCGWRFYVSPNPTNGNIVVSTTEEQKQSIKGINQIKIDQLRIIDQTGNIKKQYRFPGGITNVNISTSNLVAGVYVIQAYNGKTWEATKFVKR